MRIADTLIIHIYNILCAYSLICACKFIFTHTYFAHAYHNMIILCAYCVHNLHTNLLKIYVTMYFCCAE